jgi:type IV pilus assembly protein PilA
MKRNSRGFSLIELLMVLGIILIIAALSIPNLVRSRVAANEASGVGSLRSISTATLIYSSTYGNGFPPTLGVAGGPTGATQSSCDQALLIDSILSGGGGSAVNSQKSGYTFNYFAIAPISNKGAGCGSAGSNSFVINAVPVTPGRTGQRTFCTDESGIIRSDSTGAANPTTTASCSALPSLQ